MCRYVQETQSDGSVTKTHCCCTHNAHVYWVVFLIAFGIFLTCLATFLPPVLDDMVNSGLDDIELLTPDAMNSNNDAWQAWTDTRNDKATPLSYKIWMFNITNPQEVLQGQPVIVQEVGPYVYTEHTVHSQNTFGVNEDGSATLTANTWKFYVYEPTKTAPNLSQNDTFTTLDIVFQGLAGVPGSDTLLPILYPSSRYTNLTRMFTNRTVYEMAFGYNDSVLATLGDPWFPGLVINQTQEEALANGFDTWTTGDNNENWKIRQYQKWHSSDSVKCPGITGQPITAWDSSVKYDSNRIFGTDGSIFQRNPPEGGNLQAYVDVLFREVTIANIGNVKTTFKGINLQRYILPDNIMANSTVDPYNAAYYSFGDTGMANLTRCSQGAKIMISKPHFLDVESSTNTTGKVIGLSPNRDEHDTYLDVEPISGLCMHAAKRLQINALVEPVTVRSGNGVSVWFSDLLPLLYVPVMWIEEGGEIKDSDADDFKAGVYFVQDFNYYIYWIGYIIGYFCIGVGAIILAYWSRKPKTPKEPTERSLNQPLL